MVLSAEAAQLCLEVLPIPVLLVQSGNIVWANTAIASLTGFSKLELETMRFIDLIVPERHILSNSEVPIELELLTRQATSLWVECTVRSLEINGQPFELITLQDVEERRKIELALEHHETTYRQAIEGSLDGFYLLQNIYDDTHQLVDFSFADMSGMGEALLPTSREELIGKSISEAFPINRTGGFVNRYKQVFEIGQVLDEDFWLPRADGSRHWYHHQVVPVPSGVAIFMRDITERKLIEDAHRESELRYRALFNQSNDGVGLIGLNGTHILANQQLASMFGYRPEEMVGMKAVDFVPPHEQEGTLDVIATLTSGGHVPLYERVFRRKGGTEFLAEVNVALVRDTEGNPLYLQTIIRDISKRKAIETALRESEERYRIISELISDYAFAIRIEPDGALKGEWLTDSFTRITGYSLNTMETLPGNWLFHPGDRARVDEDTLRAVHGEPVSGEYRLITRSGEVRWVHIFRKPVRDDQGQVIRYYGAAHDITQRKRSEEELRNNEEKYRLLAENATDMIARHEMDGRFTYVSSVIRSMLGYEPEELIGHSLLEYMHPDDYENGMYFLEALQETSEPITFSCRMIKQGGDFVWFEITAKTMFGSGGTTVKEFISVSRDISQRKQIDAILMDQERLRLELQQEQELNQAKTNLMRTISHEFRTPLSVIMTSTDFLDQYAYHLSLEQRQDRLRTIRVQVERMGEMLDDISFVMQGSLQRMSAHPAQMNLETFCREIVEEIQSTIGQKHEFVFITDGQLQSALADKALIRRIVGNLLSNAVKYSPENPLITLSLARQDDDAVIRISDQGLGISAEEQKHIFEAFYRGHQVLNTISGTGLGLSIVKDCVDLHGGTITVESQPGQGTTFTVTLPQKTVPIPVE